MQEKGGTSTYDRFVLLEVSEATLSFSQVTFYCLQTQSDPVIHGQAEA